MGINVKHTPGAGVFAVPAYLAGQEDLRRHMEKMDQQRVEVMLKAQQAREENAVKIAMQDAQINAQANSQRAGQMHDFQRMQFGAGLNAAQDKVNFDQQQAIQQKGIDAQVALQAAQQKAIADRMKEDDERAKADRIRREQLAAVEKAAAEKKLEQDRINQASAAEDTRTIDAVAKAANPQEKAAALDIIRKEAESKTAQQIAREALLQTHEFSAEQQEAMKKANEQIKKIDAAILTPQQKFDMQKPHREVLDNMMPAARRKSLQEQIEYGPNGEQITRDKSGAIVVKPPVKLHDVDKMFAQQREWFDSNVKAGMSPAEAEAAARAKMQEYQNLIRMDAEVRQRVQKGENEIDVRAELEQKYRSVAPVPQAPQTTGQAPVATPSVQPPQGMQQQAPPQQTPNAIGGQKEPAPGIVAPATTKPLTVAEQSFEKVQEAMKGGDWPDSQDAKMERYQKLASERQKIAAEAARDEKGNPRKPHEIAAIVEDKAPLPVVTKEPVVITSGRNGLTFNLKAGDEIPPPPPRPTDIEMWGSRSKREGYENHVRVYEAAKAQQKKEIVQRVQDEYDAKLPPMERTSFRPVNERERETMPGIAGTINGVPVLSANPDDALLAASKMAPGATIILPDGRSYTIPKR